MSETIYVYDTVAQADTLIVEVKRPELLQQRYFPTIEPKDIFIGKKVLIDLDQGDFKKGAFVSKGYVNGNTTTMFSNFVNTPRIAPEDTIDLSEDEDRQLMEQLSRRQGDLVPTHADALNALGRIKTMRIVDRTARSIEVLCAMALKNNAIQFQMPTSPTDSTPVTVDVEFFDSSNGGKNPQVYTPAADWGESGATPYNDVCEMIVELEAHGGRAVDLLMSEKMWQYLYADMVSQKNIKDQIHYTVMATGDVKDLFSEEVEDAKCVGTAAFNGTVLNLLVYKGAYEEIVDNAPVTVKYLSDEFVCLLAPGCGHTVCGSATLPNLMSMVDPNADTAVERTGKYILSKIVNPYLPDTAGKALFRCESRPLPAPRKVWGWITLGSAPDGQGDDDNQDDNQDDLDPDKG